MIISLNFLQGSKMAVEECSCQTWWHCLWHLTKSTVKPADTKVQDLVQTGRDSKSLAFNSEVSCDKEVCGITHWWDMPEPQNVNTKGNVTEFAITPWSTMINQHWQISHIVCNMWLLKASLTSKKPHPGLWLQALGWGSLSHQPFQAVLTALRQSHSSVVVFWPGLAWKPCLWLGLRWLWLSQTPGQAKAVNHGLALAWPGPGHSFSM